MTKAIRQLPVHRAPDQIWGKISEELDMEVGLSNLDNALLQYIELKSAPGHVWDDLEQKLEVASKEAPMRRAIETLPCYEAPVRFENLALDKEKTNRQLSIAWTTGIAASLLIIFGLYFLQEPNEHIMISNTTEEITAPNEILKVAIGELNQDDELLEVIKAHCSKIALQCQSPEFKGLFEYYLELDTSKQELITTMNNHKSQLHLVDYLVRVEKEKNEVGKQLIQMIIG
ncbi:hypothetical protein [Fulvivirga sp. M361]|uniref:hypothetical protein n=1 Tax=Fulvivirga sp. M361 TaxID=2594266 RepID=UPI00117B35D6|nr:hypothetical protein [Fulvivirga sp. M361]